MMVEKQLTRERASSWSWILQAFTGVMLVVLLGLHMVVQHFVVAGGLRNYQQVAQYISNPFLFLLEIAFLIIVTWHAMLGVRAVILDLGLKPATERKVTAILSIVGIVVVAYGIWLSATIVARGT
jgi:succinate dehydrogenase / fumarate reductase membrane anchor subunit